jgi:hypothetical protein
MSAVVASAPPTAVNLIKTGHRSHFAINTLHAINKRWPTSLPPNLGQSQAARDAFTVTSTICSLSEQTIQRQSTSSGQILFGGKSVTLLEAPQSRCSSTSVQGHTSRCPTWLVLRLALSTHCPTAHTHALARLFITCARSPQTICRDQDLGMFL